MDPLASKKTYRVLYDFNATATREAQVSKGDIVLALAPEERGWLKIRLVKNPKVEGFVPFMFLKPSGAISRPGGKGVKLQLEKIPEKQLPSAPTATTGSARSAPSVPAFSGENAAIEHAECSICFNPMISRHPVCYLVRADGKRACRHYLHRVCLDRLMAEKKPHVCAVCHAPYASFNDVPDFETDPEAFFETVDYDHNFKLNKGEVIAILKALVDVDYRKLEMNVENFWSRWDSNQDGTVSFQEMMHPKTGLIQYVRMTFPVPKAERTPPKLTDRSRRDFFHYWDEDGSGTLSIDEVCRAIVKTYHKGDTSETEIIRNVLEGLWPMFDHDGNGVVDEDEFGRVGGLAETLMANYDVGK